jgi:hypothetical protein
VKWKGYGDDGNTWEKRAKLIQDVPVLVKEFDDRKK